MNDNEIEMLLRSAPRPVATNELEERLLDGIPSLRSGNGPDEPVKAGSFWSRLMPAVAVRSRGAAGSASQARGPSPGYGPIPAFALGVLLLSCLIGLGVQTSQFLELKEHNDALRKAVSGLEELRRENAELEALREQAVGWERARKEHAELLTLREEAESLRGRIQEGTALETEHQRLLQAREEQAAQAGFAPEPDPFAQAQERAQRIQCVSHIKQILLAGRMWAVDRKETVLPQDFQSMVKELPNPKILTCRGDTGRKPAADWSEFGPGSVSYQMLTPGASFDEADTVYVRCPIHNNVGLVDGSAHMLGPDRKLVTIDGKTKLVPKGSFE